MGIERWAVSNTQFAPKADGMWVRHEDHEAAMEEAQERLDPLRHNTVRATMKAFHAELDEAKADVERLDTCVGHWKHQAEVLAGERDEVRAALSAEMKTGDLLARQRDEAQARAERANDGRTEAHAQRDAALAEIGAVKKELDQALAAVDEIARQRDEIEAAVKDARYANDLIARLTARLRHYEELMVERAVKERAGAFDRACCDCRYWGDAHAHAVVCWACNHHSCWRPKT